MSWVYLIQAFDQEYSIRLDELLDFKNMFLANYPPPTMFLPLCRGDFRKPMDL